MNGIQIVQFWRERAEWREKEFSKSFRACQIAFIFMSAFSHQYSRNRSIFHLEAEKAENVKSMLIIIPACFYAFPCLPPPLEGKIQNPYCRTKTHQSYSSREKTFGWKRGSFHQDFWAPSTRHNSKASTEIVDHQNSILFQAFPA